jgi:ribosome-binding ATPase YchF (GTP1/OBG family)
MQQRINPDMDIVAYVLDEVLKAKPEDSFCKSIYIQYMERGGLSKKQLEGLFGKAQRIEGIHPGKLATLEAIIKKKHVTHRSTVTVVNAVEEKDADAEKMIDDILAKYPQHKRVLLFKSKFEKDGKLIQLEKAELEKFHKLLMK